MKKITFGAFVMLFSLSVMGLQAQKQVEPSSTDREITQFKGDLNSANRVNFERKSAMDFSQAESFLRASLSSNTSNQQEAITYSNSANFRGGDPFCSQEQVSNAFENGLFMEAGGNFLVANDFLVSANTLSFDVSTITVNLFSQGGIANVDVIFREDDSGLPGAQIGSTVSVVPTSQPIIGNNFGFDIHDVLLDLPTVVNIPGTGTETVRYWLQLIATPNTPDTRIAWESTSASIVGVGIAGQDTTLPDGWVIGNDPVEDGVFTIEGTCSQVSGCLAPENVVVSPMADSADISWDAETGATNGYVVSVYEGGADPMTATAVFTETVPSGTTMSTATGLMGESNYDVYVSSDCDGTTSGTTIVTFTTTVEAAVCGNSALDSGGRNGGYGANEVTTTTITPDNAGDVVTITFTYSDIEVSTTGEGNAGGCWDFITIYNGPDTASPVLAQNICGEASTTGNMPSNVDNNIEIGSSYTSTDASGALTIVFSSDGSVNLTGYEAEITCGPPPPCVTPTLEVTNVELDSADFSWNEIANATNGYILTVYNAGDDPTMDPAVYTENVAAGTTMTTATGLMDTTQYDAYIVANCGSDGPSGEDMVSFETLFPDPVCGGNFYDSGGPNGDFENDESTITTISPDVAGEVVTVTFTFVDNTEFDVLTVDVGDGSAPQVVPDIAMGEEPVSYTSLAANGALIFEFNSSGVVPNAGWEADVTCGPPPPCPQPINVMASDVMDVSAVISWDDVTEATGGYLLEVYILGESPGNGTPRYTNTIPAGTNMDTATGLVEDTSYEAFVSSSCDNNETSEVASVTFITMLNPPRCDGFFKDSGAGAGNYMNSEMTTTTIMPDIAGDAVTITFTYVDIEASATTAGVQDGCWDFLTIYNGPSTASPVLAMTLCGEESGDGSIPSVASSLLSIGDSFTSTDASGALTIVFTSDSSVAETGWSADVTCASLSVDEFGSNNFTFYPNPVTGVLNLTSQSTIDSVEVVNMLGQRILSEKPMTQDYALDLSSLAVGQYFLRAEIDGKVVVEKLLKE